MNTFRSMRAELELTADGSHTLFIPELDEHYHSTNGAISESQHVFLKMGLRHLDKRSLHVFEVGFGTGLNALLTLLEARNEALDVRYSTIEAYPLSLDLVDMLNFSLLGDVLEEKNLYTSLHQSSWDEDVQLDPNFRLRKIHADFTQFDFDQLEKFDLVYFDAFAPDKQSDMWQEAIFAKIYEHSNQGAVLTTYCAKGVIRRMLQSVGYTVERLPGPPGKREMLRATKV